MPEVKPNESRNDYLSRCVPYVMNNENLDQQAAVGKCEGMYNSHKNKSLIQKGISELTAYISKLEHDEIRKQFQIELPEFTVKSKQEITDLTGTGLTLMEDIYLRCRKDNLTVDKSFEIAKSIYNREYKNIDRSDILRSVEEVLKNIQVKQKVLKDDRPPKKWWDEAISAISENPDVTDPEKLTGWVWYHHKKKSIQKAEDIEKDESAPKDWWDRMVSTLGKVPDVEDPKALANWIWHEKVHKARTVEGFESPEPGNISEKGKQILASTYASCRKDGGDKDKCAKIAWNAVKEAGEK